MAPQSTHVKKKIMCPILLINYPLLELLFDENLFRLGHMNKIVKLHNMF